jgi:hypothetical protein
LNENKKKEPAENDKNPKNVPRDYLSGINDKDAFEQEFDSHYLAGISKSKKDRDYDKWSSKI